MSPARFAALRALMCISERDAARLAGLSPGGLRVQLQRGNLLPDFAAWLERRAESWRADPPPARAGKRCEPPPVVDMAALREAIGTRPEAPEDRATRRQRIAEDRAAKAGEPFPKSRALIAEAVAEAVAAMPPAFAEGDEATVKSGNRYRVLGNVENMAGDSSVMVRMLRDGTLYGPVRFLKAANLRRVEVEAPAPARKRRKAGASA